MRSGEVEANLLNLNTFFKLPYIDDLIERKLSGREKSVVPDVDMALHERQYNRLRSTLEQAYIDSRLPEVATCKAMLDNLLVKVRLG